MFFCDIDEWNPAGRPRAGHGQTVNGKNRVEQLMVVYGAIICQSQRCRTPNHARAGIQEEEEEVGALLEYKYIQVGPPWIAAHLSRWLLLQDSSKDSFDLTSLQQQKQSAAFYIRAAPSDYHMLADAHVVCHIDSREGDEISLGDALILMYISSPFFVSFYSGERRSTDAEAEAPSRGVELLHRCAAQPGSFG